MKNPFRKIIIEKPNFKMAPKVTINFNSYCYLLPTLCGFSKSMSDNRYSERQDNREVYECQYYLITYAFTLFFLWMRIHVECRQEKWGKSLMQNYVPTDKSKSFVEDFIID